MTAQAMDEKKDDVNGASNQTAPVLDIESKEKLDMERNLETLRQNILGLASRYDKAFTTEEKTFIVNRIKLMEYNYKVLRTKYEQRFDLLELKDIARNTTTDDEGYDVDDPQVRKRIGRGLSYNSGRQGYTQKEIEELKRLIPDIDEPVSIPE